MTCVIYLFSGDGDWSGSGVQVLMRLDSLELRWDWVLWIGLGFDLIWVLLRYNGDEGRDSLR